MQWDCANPQRVSCEQAATGKQGPEDLEVNINLNHSL